MSFNAANEITGDCWFFELIVRKLDAEVIFHHHHQLEAIRPVSSEMIEEASAILRCVARLPQHRARNRSVA
jgi:hypothetical protein